MGKQSKFDGEMKQIDREMKQNVLGRCPKGKVRIHRNMYAALWKIQCSWARQEGDGGGGQHYVGGGDGGRHNGEAGEQCNAWGVGSRGS